MSHPIGNDHDRRIVAQFGPRAQAYVESADHARGRDLDRLAALVANRRGGRCLDLGCGGGHVSLTVAPFVDEVVAFDLSNEMLSAVRAAACRRGIANIKTEQGTVSALPFAPSSFDLVLTRFSAHHWPDLSGPLAEMRRVVRLGGLVVVMHTVSPDTAALDEFINRVEVLRDPSHVRDHTVAEWHEALAQAGLRPSMPILSHLRLDFGPWISRMGTPDRQALAIRQLQSAAAPEIAAHFGFEPDGSFTIDTMMLEADA